MGIPPLLYARQGKSYSQYRLVHQMLMSSDFHHVQLLKRRIRILKFLLRIATLVLALYMIATMSLTFHKFFSTRNYVIDVADPKTGTFVTRGPWAKNTKTWPTTVLLVTSVISFIISAVVVAAYVRSVRASNAAYEYGSYLSVGIFATHVGMWIAVAAAYRAGKDSNDLWGWTCDERAMRIQQPFENVINFKRYCDIQSSSWITSLAQAVLMLLTVAIYAWAYVRLRGQREMGRKYGEDVYEHRESRWSRFIPTKH